MSSTGEKVELIPLWELHVVLIEALIPAMPVGIFLTSLCMLKTSSVLTLATLSSRQDRIPNDLNTRDAGEVTCVLRQDRES